MEHLNNGTKNYEKSNIASFQAVKMIGLISDTHGVLEDTVLDYFKDVNVIFHGGDIGFGKESKKRESEQSILTKLSTISPVLAVCGNVDKASSLPNIQLFDLNHGFIKGVIIHGDKHKIKWCGKDILGEKYPEVLAQDLVEIIKNNQINMVVFGHSHIPGIIFSNGILYVNPGSAGPKRFSLPRTVGYVSFIDDKVMVNIFDIIEQCNIYSLEIAKQNFLTRKLL